MPYQTEDYQPPSLPELREIKNFHEVRDAVSRIMQYLQHLQAVNHSYFQLMRHNLNAAGSTEAPDDIPVANEIAPTRFMNVIIGTGTVTQVRHPLRYAGQIMLISQDGFYLASGGNLSLLTSPNHLAPGQHIVLTWIPSKAVWVADTCRLSNTRSSLAIGGRNILTEPPTATDFAGGTYLQVGKFVLASLAASSVQVDLPVPVAGGPSWGGPVFNYTGITLSGGYSQLSVEADGGSSTVNLIESGSAMPSQPVQPAQLDTAAKWQGTIWYRTP